MRSLRQVFYDLSIENAFLWLRFLENIALVASAIQLQYRGVLSPVTTYGASSSLIVSCLQASFKLWHLAALNFILENVNEYNISVPQSERIFSRQEIP